jgi:hypothetical protein
MMLWYHYFLSKQLPTNDSHVFLQLLQLLPSTEGFYSWNLTDNPEKEEIYNNPNKLTVGEHYI